MKLGLILGYSGAELELPLDLILEADRSGVDVLWTAEAYGSDSISPLAWIGGQTESIHLGTAIMQMAARTPAMTAMTAMTLDQLSGGRFRLGLGVSGPQVVEGWHGKSFAKPLGKTREYIQIVRKIFEREEKLDFLGNHYQIPYQGKDASGLGKPLKSIIHGRKDIPIYLAAIGPKNIRLAAEIADGWLPIFFSPRHYDTVFKEHVESGLTAANSSKNIKDFDIAPTVLVAIGEDLEYCRNQIKPILALYIGGMGARGKNFYYDLACRYGYEDAANTIQDLYLSGEKMSAIMAVPDQLVDDVSLCGPRDKIKEQLEHWKASPITTLNITVRDKISLATMIDLVL